MGFSLFGRSGDNVTTQETTNTTNDFTTNNSNNTNITSTLNAALTRNSSFIQNDTNIQNTALQVTDSFNRVSNVNLANVGNTTIGATPAPMDYAALFAAFPQGKINQTPIDLSKPLLDFTALSRIATDNILASGKVAGEVQTGFAANTAATGGILAGLMPGSASSSMIWKIVAVVAAVVIVAVLARRKN